MGLRFFLVPVRDSENAERELNGFLATHKVLSIDRQLVDVGMNSFWAICVDYLTSSAGESTLTSNLSRSRVDYKTILPPEEFEVFSRLRQLRKDLAQSEAVPVYALFTNEQLAQRINGSNVWPRFWTVTEKDIGRIGGGRKKPTGQIDVAIIQSLVRKGVVNDCVADYGHLIVDEYHHLSAQSFELVARRAKAKFVTDCRRL
jgi:hypothetical protein